MLTTFPTSCWSLRPPFMGGADLQVKPPPDPVVPLEELSAYSATHRPDGLFVLERSWHRGRGQWLEGAAIQDLAPTLMHLMGLPVAAWMDGRVLLDLFEGQLLFDQ